MTLRADIRTQFRFLKVYLAVEFIEGTCEKKLAFYFVVIRMN